MYLLNAHTLELKAFYDSEIPQYVILSHTWDAEEMTFEEMMYPNQNTEKKLGYMKIMAACAKARVFKVDWIWIDTCCIDKRSSAELSEAINSMYRYYKESYACFAFLQDARSGGNAWHGLRNAKWWSRGWTLQELIAPSRVFFYNADWMYIGTRQGYADTISSITLVPIAVLAGEDPLMYSIAQRMSWVSSRHTTRIEDMAYCMLGLLNVNMPLLYGEGAKAFIRLQEEVVKTSADQSIFAWPLPASMSTDSTFMIGVLAVSPTSFSGCSETTEMRARETSYAMTNLGLNIRLPIAQLPSYLGDTYVALLEAHGHDDDQVSGRQIFLRRLFGNQFARTSPYRKDPPVVEGYEYTTINIVQHVPVSSLQHPAHARGMILSINELITLPSVHVFRLNLVSANPEVLAELAQKRGDSFRDLIIFDQTKQTANTSCYISFHQVDSPEFEDKPYGEAIALLLGTATIKDKKHASTYAHRMWLKWSARPSAREKFHGTFEEDVDEKQSRFHYHRITNQTSLRDFGGPSESDHFLQPPKSQRLLNDVFYTLPADGQRFELDTQVRVYGQQYRLRVRCIPELVKNVLFLAVDLSWEVAYFDQSDPMNKLSLGSFLLRST